MNPEVLKNQVRIYENMFQLIAQQSWKGEVAEAVSEALSFCSGMAETINQKIKEMEDGAEASTERGESAGRVGRSKASPKRRSSRKKTSK